jgi:hypothetical protein
MNGQFNVVLLTICSSLLTIATGMQIFIIKTVINHGESIAAINTRCKIYHKGKDE